MKNYLAKSFNKETVQEHTDNLIRQFYNLKSLYPNLDINYDLLYYACLYHDLGKINEKFQSKIRGKVLENELPHGVLSTAFLDFKKLKEQFTKEEIEILYSSIFYHHDRASLNDIDDNLIYEEIEKLKEELKYFKYDKIGQIENLKYRQRYIKRFNDIEEDNEKIMYYYIKIKGLLNKIDYAASSYIDVEIKNDFLMSNLDNFINKLNKKNGAKWNNLQKYMMNNQNDNLVVIAQTGMGKTEAGLLWIGNNKGFFTLPLKTSLNAMYLRIKNDLFNNENYFNKLGLLHSDTKKIYLENFENDNDFKSNKHDKNAENISFEEYYNKTRQLSLPLTICTLDQLFIASFKFRNYENILATLSYSKIVIDEIQMYSSEIIAYIISMLYMINMVGGKFAILTATFPSFLKKIMIDNKIPFKMNENDFNCYIFDGGEKECSGIGHIIDRDIFNISKEKLNFFIKNKKNSFLTEKEKLEIIDSVYSFDSVKNTDYYKRIIEYINYSKSFFVAEKSKKEAQRLFRNIHSVDVIPYCIFLENEKFIEDTIKKIRLSNNMKEISCLIDKIRDLTLSVEYNIVLKSNVIKKLEINKYYEFDVVDCEYDENLGFRFKKKEESINENISDSFF